MSCRLLIVPSFKIQGPFGCSIATVTPPHVDLVVQRRHLGRPETIDLLCTKQKDEGETGKLGPYREDDVKNVVVVLGRRIVSEVVDVGCCDEGAYMIGCSDGPGHGTGQ